jgi:hypothetical protein
MNYFAMVDERTAAEYEHMRDAKLLSRSFGMDHYQDLKLGSNQRSYCAYAEKKSPGACCSQLVVNSWNA